MNVQFRCPTCSKELNESLSCGKCKKTYHFKDGIYTFMEDTGTETWDTYWKRIFIYDDVMDILRPVQGYAWASGLPEYYEPGISSDS